MKLLIISHKLCWRRDGERYVTTGGFPHQVAALSELFDHTDLVVPVSRATPPAGLSALTGKALTVRRCSPLPSAGWRRRLGLGWWLLRHGFSLWRLIGQADVVHTPVPSDVGGVALLLALARRRRLFVRHCGTWDARRTLADRGLSWLLRRVADQGALVMATGGGSSPPSPGRPEIEWIFSTTLREAELDGLDEPTPWRPGEPLRLISVGRLTREKNVQATIAAFAIIHQSHPRATLTVLGDGLYRPCLEEQVEELKLADAVAFRGNRSHGEVLAELQRSHLLLFPSRVAEGFPKALIEALACGVPAVATAVSVIPALLSEAGVVLPATTPEAVAEAVLELLERPQELAVMASRARQRGRGYTLEAWRDLIGDRLARRGWLEEARIRVAHLIGGLDPGGSERQLLLFLAHADRRRFDHAVIVLNAAQDALKTAIEELGIPVHAVPSTCRGRLQRVGFLVRTLRALGVDLVHSWSFFANPYAAVAGRLARIPARLGSLRGSLAAPSARSLAGPLRWLALHGVGFLVVNARSVEREMLAAGVAGGHVVYIPNGLAVADSTDTSTGASVVEEGRQDAGLPSNGSTLFGDLATAHELGGHGAGKSSLDAELARLGLTSVERLIGAVGHLREVKNHALMVRALARVLPDLPDVGAVILGREVTEEAEVKQQLEEMIVELGLGGRVVLAGQCDDVHRWLARMSVFCHPSRFEAMPNAVLEAMAAGLPVVATRVGELEELIVDGEDGILVGSDDEDEMAAALRRILADSSLAARLGERAASKVRRRFSCKTTAAALESLYSRACGRR